MKRMLIVVICLAVVASFAMAGGGQEGSATEAKGDDDLVIGYSVQNLTNTQFFDNIDAVDAVIEAAGGKVIKADAQFDAARQMADIENFISQGVDGIMVIGVDPNGLKSVVKKAKEAGIPVVACDAFMDCDDLAALVTSNNYAGGYEVGQYMNELLGGEGNLFAVNIPHLIDCQERVQGVIDGLGEDSNVKFITQQQGGAMDDGMRIMETWLEKYDDIDAVYCINDANALGCIQAIEAAGREDEIKVFGNDGVEEAYQAMRDGRILYATVQQQSSELGRISAETMLKAIRGENLDPIIYVPVYMVTREDVQNGLKRPKGGKMPAGMTEATANTDHVIGVYDYETVE